jgi:hypothetical protein
MPADGPPPVHPPLGPFAAAVRGGGGAVGAELLGSRRVYLGPVGSGFGVFGEDGCVGAWSVTVERFVDTPYAATARGSGALLEKRHEPWDPNPAAGAPAWERAGFYWSWLQGDHHGIYLRAGSAPHWAAACFLALPRRGGLFGGPAGQGGATRACARHETMKQASQSGERDTLGSVGS